MDKATFKITKTIEEEYELKIGDYIIYTLSDEWCTREGKVTYIFDKGRRCIVDDERVIYVSAIISINGVKIQ